MEKAIRLAKLKKIDATSVRILKAIAEQIGDREERVSYPDLERSLDLSWNAISRSIDRMVEDGLIERKDGKLSLQGTIVTLKEKSS